MNPDYRIKDEKEISGKWGRLLSVSYALRDKDGAMQDQKAEIYDRRNAVAVLLYNKAKATVLLLRQFRLATVYKGNSGGMLLEVCAGMVDGDDSAEDTARREVMEETGYDVKELRHVMNLFMSPGVLTEQLHFFVAEYEAQDKQGDGGGLDAEGEHIELIELSYTEAMDMVAQGAIMDAKTVILLQYAGVHGLLQLTNVGL